MMMMMRRRRQAHLHAAQPAFSPVAGVQAPPLESILVLQARLVGWLVVPWAPGVGHVEEAEEPLAERRRRRKRGKSLTIGAGEICVRAC